MRVDRLGCLPLIPLGMIMLVIFLSGSTLVMHGIKMFQELRAAQEVIRERYSLREDSKISKTILIEHSRRIGVSGYSDSATLAMIGGSALLLVCVCSAWYVFSPETEERIKRSEKDFNNNNGN